MTYEVYVWHLRGGGSFTANNPLMAEYFSWQHRSPKNQKYLKHYCKNSMTALPHTELLQIILTDNTVLLYEHIKRPKYVGNVIYIFIVI